VDRSGNASQVYFFETTPRGVRYQQATENARYRPDWQAASKVVGTAWNAVMIIPLKAMRINAVRNIFYPSGSGVYGDRPNVAFSEGYGPCFPISTYGASKLACEALISSYCHMFDFIGRAFRFANVVGPRQTHGVGYDFVRRLKGDPTRLRILGDGSQRKAYIHVDDVLDALFLVHRLIPDTVSFDVYNVATDDYITVNEIAEIAVSECRLAASSVQFSHTGGDRGWKGDVPKVLFDVKKIKQLGWRSKRSSAEAVRDALRAMIAELEHEFGVEYPLDDFDLDQFRSVNRIAQDLAKMSGAIA